VTDGITLSHVGICVSDMGRAVRFYTEGLGFTPTIDYEVGAEFGPLMELDAPQVASQFLTSGGASIELLQFVEPGHEGDGGRRRMNALGLTHLCLRVEDVDRAAAAVVAAGGTVVDGTRTTVEVGGGATAEFVYCTDPDGTRIELMHLPG
jgi:catechol 2,3-dioxygenase-like lactoylglutathione lyase family enzyme